MIPGVDLNLLWAAAAGLVVGAGVVFLLMRRGGSVNRERAESLASELEETRLELESHREEVSGHFARTSDLFRDLTEQYTRLYAHLAKGAREFCPDDVPSLGQGLDTPLLVDESPDSPEEEAAAAPVSAAADPTESEGTGAQMPEGDAARVASAASPADAGEESLAEKREQEAPRGAAEDEESTELVTSEAPEQERVAVAAPLPGAASPPVGTKTNGGSHLTH